MTLGVRKSICDSSFNLNDLFLSIRNDRRTKVLEAICMTAKYLCDSTFVKTVNDFYTLHCTKNISFHLSLQKKSLTEKIIFCALVFQKLELGSVGNFSENYIIVN